MHIDDLPFEVTAVLGKAELPLAAYLGLHVGDILVLDQPIEQGLAVRVGEKERYLATAGLFETYKAITIDERIYT